MCSDYAVARVAPVSDKKRLALPRVLVFYLEALLSNQHEDHTSQVLKREANCDHGLFETWALDYGLSFNIDIGFSLDAD